MEKLFVNTLLKKQKNRKPIWLMRQAGRYLPEYMEIRNKRKDFLELCYSPSDAARVTLQPIERFNFDAAIIFSDILVIPDALNQKVRFEKNEGPKLEQINCDNLHKLQFNEDKLNPVYEAIDITRSKLPGETALIGFAGAPWTIATYMVEGKSGTDFKNILRWIKNDPHSFNKLIDILVPVITKHLVNQIKAGCDSLQLFDSWAGVLDAADYDEYVIKPTMKIVQNVKELFPKIPIIGFPRKSDSKYELFAKKTGVDAVSVDQEYDITKLANIVGDKVVLQGNLDNIILAENLPLALEKTKLLLEKMRNNYYIFNLGHGVLPNTPVEHVAAVVDAIKQFNAEN